VKAIVQTAAITVRIPEYEDPEKVKWKLSKQRHFIARKMATGESSNTNSANKAEIDIAYLEGYLTNPDDAQHQTYTRVDYDIV